METAITQAITEDIIQVTIVAITTVTGTGIMMATMVQVITMEDITEIILITTIILIIIIMVVRMAILHEIRTEQELLLLAIHEQIIIIPIIMGQTVVVV